MANVNTDGFCYPTAESLYKILLLRNMECVNYYVTRKQNAYKNNIFNNIWKTSLRRWRSGTNL